jgi:small subunit ribosomal protein S1
MAEHPKGSIVKGIVKKVDIRGAEITLAGGVEGYIKSSDLARDRIEDATKLLKEGDTLEARFVGVDRKNRIITLSVKAKEIQEEQEAVEEYKGTTAGAGKTSLGDILKEQMGE